MEVEGPVLLLLSPPVFKREEGGPSTSFGKSWRQRDRGLRGYCILSATREEPHPPRFRYLSPKKGVLVQAGVIGEKGYNRWSKTFIVADCLCRRADQRERRASEK